MEVYGSAVDGIRQPRRQSHCDVRKTDWLHWNRYKAYQKVDNSINWIHANAELFVLHHRENTTCDIIVIIPVSEANQFA